MILISCTSNNKISIVKIFNNFSIVNTQNEQVYLTFSILAINMLEMDNLNYKRK